MSGSNYKVVCDQCGKEFIINKIREKKLNGGVMIQYFTCSHCGKRYKISLMDAYLKKMIASKEANAKKRKYENKLERTYGKQIERFLNEVGEEDQ